jgi:hypothetical protein
MTTHFVDSNGRYDLSQNRSSLHYSGPTREWHVDFM